MVEGGSGRVGDPGVGHGCGGMALSLMGEVQTCWTLEPTPDTACSLSLCFPTLSLSRDITRLMNKNYVTTLHWHNNIKGSCSCRTRPSNHNISRWRRKIVEITIQCRLREERTRRLIRCFKQR